MFQKALRVFLLTLSVISIVSCSEKKADEKITLGNENWAVSRALNYLGKVVLEQNGIPAEVVNSDIENIYEDLGEGKIDLFLDTWVEGHSVYLYEFKEVEDLGAIYKGCRLGIAVPDYFDVDSISQLKEDSSTYGNVFYGIEKDGGVMISSKTAMKQYGMNPEVVNMSEDELVKQLQLMVSKKQNFVTGAWHPHGKMQELNLKFLVDTTNSFIQNDEIHKYARPGFKMDYPKAAEILSKITFSEDEMTNYLLALKGAKNEEDIVPRIKEWIKENPEVSKGWIN